MSIGWFPYTRRSLFRGGLLSASLLLSCADPTARFDEFVDRYASANPEGPSDGPTMFNGKLPTPEQAAGEFLLAISITLNRARPIMNLLEVKAEQKGDSLELQMRYRPLLASDRKTPAGEFGEWQTILIAPDGTYNGDTMEASIPGSANPINGLDSQAELGLGGTLAIDQSSEKVNFLCGDVTGRIITPFPLPLAGSTFTATRIEDPNNYPDIVINCKKDPAEALK